MSFLKNLTKEFKELKASLSGDGDKEKEEKKEEKHESSTEGQRAFDPGYGAPSPNYAQPAPAPYNQYHPQPLSPPQGPPLPPGWVAQFDQGSGRWYYIEQATGISRWEPPASPAPYGQYDHSQVPQYAGAYGSQGAYPGQPAPYPGQLPYPGQAPYPGQGGYYDPSMGAPPGGDYSHSKGEKSDKDDKSKMLLGAAGGLAVGAVGGALVANALADDSDNETQAAAAAPPPASAPPPAGLPPDETADGDSVSSSDREDVLEARQEYEQAQLAAQDSDASSSEEEALEEAREEYEETYEEVYDD